VVGELAQRLTGSSDLYQADTRRPSASINFITAHDGFTLHDLVSYDYKHNEANQEGNRDGESHNRSWNCGTEGPTDDPEVLRCREKQRRNFLATLMLSQGVPMVLAGDELGRTQGGNNNAYCQDNQVSWLDWAGADRDLLDFTRRLIHFRRRHPVFRRRRWFQGRPLRGVEDIAWLRPDGQEMEDHDWNAAHTREVGVFLNGAAIMLPDQRGRRVRDDTFLVLMNGSPDPIDWRLPDARYGEGWVVAVDSSTGLVEGVEDGDRASADTGGAPFAAGESVPLEARSLIVLRRSAPSSAAQ
jgi:isoamylase